MISIVFVSNINFPLIFPSKTAKTNLPIQVSVSEFCERGVVAVLSGRSRFSQAQKGSGSRTVYRRHRREEILIRPTVLDNAYRNSSSRVESRNDLSRAVAFSLLLSFSHSLYLPPLCLPFSTCVSALLSPSSLLLIRPSSPSSSSSFHRQFLSGNEGTVLASIIPTSILPWPCWKNPASSLLVHGRTVPLPPPCPFAASTTSRLAPVPRGYLFPSPSSSYSLLVRYPEPPSFRPFSNPFATRQPALFLFRCRERVQGRDSAKELVRFSIFSVRRPTGLKDGTEVGGLSTDTELKSVHRAGKWNLLRRPSIRSTLFSLFFFLLFSISFFSTNTSFFFDLSTLDFPFFFLCLCL